MQKIKSLALLVMVVCTLAFLNDKGIIDLKKTKQSLVKLYHNIVVPTVKKVNTPENRKNAQAIVDRVKEDIHFGE